MFSKNYKALRNTHIWKQKGQKQEIFDTIINNSDRQLLGKVEETDPRSADYSLTPLRGLVGLLHGLPSTAFPR